MISLGSKEAGTLSNMEIDAIGEILNISLGTSATSVSELLGQPVKITTPKVEVMKTKDFNIKTYEPAIGVEINYVKGLDGQNILILKESDVKVIVGLLLQTDFSDREFVMDEMNIGAICEVMNQMMGASATALSQFLNRAISISPPNSFSIDNTEQFKNKYFPKDEDIVAVYFNLMIGKLVNSQFINVMRTGLAKELISNFGLESPAPVAAPVPPAAAPPAPEPKPAPDSKPASAPAAKAAVPEPKPAPAPAAPPAAAAPAPSREPASAPAGGYRVRGAVYPVFDPPKKKLSQGETSNLGMILSVPLQITVEIGRTTKQIKEILDFSEGTIVELDRPAGSKVDVYVNGKAIAKGDVVVVDDNYGVRITEILNNSEIMKLL